MSHVQQTYSASIGGPKGWKRTPCVVVISLASPPRTIQNTRACKHMHMHSHTCTSSCTLYIFSNSLGTNWGCIDGEDSVSDGPAATACPAGPVSPDPQRTMAGRGIHDGGMAAPGGRMAPDGKASRKHTHWHGIWADKGGGRGSSCGNARHSGCSGEMRVGSSWQQTCPCPSYVPLMEPGLPAAACVGRCWHTGSCSHEQDVVYVTANYALIKLHGLMSLQKCIT